MTLMTLPDTVGYLAALLTTSSFVPQAVLTLRTRDVSGISLSMYSAFTLGVALWLLYGIAIGEWPVIVANVVTLALAATILVTKVRVERARAGAASPTVSPTATRGGGDGPQG
jgi:MtN3 and saliva related transmembrane protein